VSIILQRYVVETAIPPLLPTVFTVSVGISNDRLARKRIACSNSEGILVAGKVDMAFFDKTGTLTKQGLEFISASRMISGCAHSKDKMEGNLEVGMATCHTLTKSKAGKSNGKEAGMSETSSSSLAGVLIGNQVDIKMFLSTGAFLSQSDVIRVQMMSGRTYTVLKRFDFDHHRMTMSVIIRDEDGSLFAFAKGSGESIKKCCMPSTMPEGFDASLEQTAKEGIYQISIAMKELSNDVASSLTIITRDEIESNLLFVGVVNFKNVLREETPAVIRELWQGNVKPTMLTGDSVMTGISIARECGIIKSNESVILGKSVTASGVIEWYDDSDAKVSAPTVMSLRDSSAVLAVTGTVWESMANASFIESLALGEYIRVFGRSSPNNKADIVTAFVEKGHVCCMAGDGGNDCGALRTAHVGIALSDAEASTVSSFTSLDKSITSVVEVLKEGRCALASAFASYKYMIMYGQVETMNQLMNAYFQVTFSEWW
jgi:magnesium-transporting ATPase (P-type)